MAVFKAFAKGAAGACRKPRVLAVLWVSNLLTSGLAAAPLLFLIQRDLGHSTSAGRLRPVDILWLGGVAHRYQDAAPAIIGWLLAVLVVSLLLSIFLSGGVAGRLLDKEGSARLGPFFADCGRFFWRYLGLFLLSVPFYAAALGILPGLFSTLVGAWEKNAATEWTPLVLADARLLLVLLLLTLVQLVFDYARIIAAAEDARNVFRALGAALAFIGKRFFRSWGLHLVLWLVVAGGFAAFLILTGLLPGAGALVPAGIVLMQVFIIFRLWGKMLFFAAQAEFYRLTHY